MDRFHIVEDAAAILRSKGIYKQVKVYLRGGSGAVYAGWAGGFIRLYKGGGTGLPHVAWDDIDINGVTASSLTPDAFGKLSFLGPMKQIEAAE